MPRRLLFFAPFLFALYLGFALSHATRFRDVFRSVCDLTENHFYKADAALIDWVLECRRHAARVPFGTTTAGLLERIQDEMNEMRVSHFQIYNPAEDRKLWTGESEDTGIRARYVEDKLVVYRVLKGSAGESAGVRAGDEIVKLPGAGQVTPWGAYRRSGPFVLRRQGQELTIDVQAVVFQVDMNPTVTVYGSSAVLEIPSFRSEFFDPDDWRDLAAKLKPFRHVIVDLRDNAGGNFVAMLRALSPFTCSAKRIGAIVQPRKAGAAKRTFDDDTEDARQIDLLLKYREIGLETFGTYGCLDARVTVLVDSDTSSVAEFFANTFLNSKRGRVWGQPTAGNVVLAVWYDLPALGKGYSVSVPEAVYVTPGGEELEGRGVFPQMELFYELEPSLAGRDGWIEMALKN